MNELTVSLVRIFASVALLVIVLYAVSRATKRFALPAELGRKIIHVSLGLYCLSFPWVFANPWEVTATCALAVAVFWLARGRLRSDLGEGLHSVRRVSYGEVLFALSVALLFWLQGGHALMVADRGAPPLGPVLYVLPLLILTLCDAASALVGTSYGRAEFHIEGGTKSWEGVTVFVVTAWLVSMIVFLLFTDIGREELILLAFITAVFGALLEAASWRGLDNLFIPLGLFFLLSSRVSYYGPWGLLGVSLAFLLALALLLYFTHRRHESRHLVATHAALFYLIALFSGIQSLLMPMVAVGAYALCARLLIPRPPRQSSLDLIVAVVAIALIYYVYSHITRVNMIFAFNAAFACLTAGIVARHGAPPRIVALAIGIAMAALAVRVVLLEYASPAALVFYGAAGIAVVLTAILGYRLRQSQFNARPWSLLGGASAVAGFVLLPLSP